MSYNLTDNQKELLKWLVEQVRAGSLSEKFLAIWTLDRGEITNFERPQPLDTLPRPGRG